MSITCVIIAGSLWLSSENLMVKPNLIHKERNSDRVSVTWGYSSTSNFYTTQEFMFHNTEEFVSDCVRQGVVTHQSTDPDSIDDEECTGVGETCK